MTLGWDHALAVSKKHILQVKKFADRKRPPVSVA
jgi:hypothetical protein